MRPTGVAAASLVVLAFAGSSSTDVTAAQAARTCAGHRATIVGTPGDDHIVGKKASDVILGLGGNDVITDGPNGNDIICAGAGNDRIIASHGNDRLYGGAGNDFLMGGQGNDRLYGGAGNDRISGGQGNDLIEGGGGADRARGVTGNDKIWGGSGPDRLFGENGDDLVHGGAGDDLVDGGLGDDTPLYGGGLYGDGGSDRVDGGTGVDLVDGGPGNRDVVRGDQGPDTVVGGPGRQDIASYRTASVVSNLGWKSPGCQHTAGFALIVDMDRHTACEFLAPNKILVEKISGIEDVVGSAFDDRITGDGGPNRIDGGPGDDVLTGGGGIDQAFGGSGYDICSGFQIQSSCPGPRGSGRQTSVELDRSIDGSSSLVVLGSAGANNIQVDYHRGNYSVTDSDGISADGESSCTRSDIGIGCKAGSLSSLLVEGSAGNDRVRIANSVPTSTDVTVNGGAGDDRIIGGAGAEHLNAGPTGHDVIFGRGGGDALYAGGGGPDRLYGGPGQDLLTLPVSCRGENLVNGGTGGDNVSYALSKQSSTWVMSLKTNTAGFVSPKCGSDRLVGVSSLEGTKGRDILIGDALHNGLLGHGGRDVFRAGGGNDYVDARDGAADKLIDCGAGRDLVLADQVDRAINCENRHM